MRLEGNLNASSGAVHLHFRARFFFRVGRLYRAPALLVGVAQVPPSGEGWVDRFLGLPDEALALLRCRFHNLEPTPPR